MLSWKKFKAPEKQTIRKNKENIDCNIYTFDIETTSFIVFKGEIYQSLYYQELSKKEQKECEEHSNMYIWQFSINEDVYYGRTWNELKKFLKMLDKEIPEKKIVFIHNLSFEFQYLKSEFEFESVFARKSRNPIKAVLKDYNIEFRCSLTMSNLSLENLAKEFKLDYQKQVGLLDYDKIRHSKTPLTDEELQYAEFDCKVVYDYIKSELVQFKTVYDIPITMTGHVRRELHNLVDHNFKYKKITKQAINTNPYLYNRFLEAFQGGYTHASRLYTDEVLRDVDSYDFTSSYPYVMITRPYPMGEFKKVKIKSHEELNNNYAYILVIKMSNVKCKCHNTFISSSKCRNIRGGSYDNGRIIKADSFEITITDIDFMFYQKTYTFDYKIIESWQAPYGYLPDTFVKFIIEKYKMKTEYKGVKGKEKEYALAKSVVNSLYGMTVTNTIRDEVIFDSGLWEEVPLTDEEIQAKLWQDKEKAFLSFSWGLFVTSWARYNLETCLVKLDDYVAYADTDSLKLVKGYNKKVIEDYNKSVLKLLNYRAKMLKIPVEDLSPVDKKGIPHTLGVFDFEIDEGHTHSYDKFITQGAKKYAYEIDGDIHITVSGVPKKGSKGLKRLEDFTDGFVFRYEDTGKNTLMYIDDESPIILTDYLGNTLEVTDKSGVCFLPTTYELGKSEDYMNTLLDYSSKRAIYKGDENNDKE